MASEQTRTLYAQAALPMYFSHTLGAFRAFLEKHLPVRVLTEQDLEDANLHGVRVLVLPNVACMSDRAAEVVRRFVKAGGGLVATLRDVALRRTLPEAPGFRSGRLVSRAATSAQTPSASGSKTSRSRSTHRTRSSTTR